MLRCFDSTLWTRPGIPFERREPLRPFAEEANRLQYRPWDPPHGFWARLMWRARRRR